MSFHRHYPARILGSLGLLAFSLAACAPVPAPDVSTQTATSSPAPTVTVKPTATMPPSPTPTSLTAPALPVPYQNDTLTPFGSPHTYIQDQCQYLQDKWSSKNSPPGTVVMTIMFHSITGGSIASSDQITEFNFRQLMKTLYDQGFTAINTAQLADFLEQNAKIPERSVLLVVDDRHYAQYFNVWFGEYWTNYGWPVVNAWISTDLSTADLWQQQVNLENEGFVDHQAHGYQHFAIGPDSTDDYILQELQKPIEAFQLHFNKTPTAFIWPGGRFTPHAVEMARNLGYQLGFTVNPRGPVMFNWVPLADKQDPARPSWDAEGPANDPLLVLPRYWDTDAIIHIKDVIQIGQEAAAYAGQNKEVEMEYYNIVCKAQFGPIP